MGQWENVNILTLGHCICLVVQDILTLFKKSANYDLLHFMIQIHDLMEDNYIKFLFYTEATVFIYHNVAKKMMK